MAYLDSDDYNPPEPWEVRPIDRQERNPRVTSRYYKLLPHRLFEAEAEISIWIDGSLRATADFTPLMGRVSETAPLAAFAHPERRCVYDEARAVMAARVAIPQRVEAQMNAYRAEGYPAQRGLFQSGLLVRRHHDPALSTASEDWWQAVRSYSQRDQLSGMVALWRQDLTYVPLLGKLSDYVEYVHHPQTDHYLKLG